MSANDPMATRTYRRIANIVRELRGRADADSSVTWNAARRDEQFREALTSRDIIGQAKGMMWVSRQPPIYLRF